MRGRLPVVVVLALLASLAWAPSAQAAAPLCGYWLKTSKGRTLHCMYLYQGKAYQYEYTSAGWRQLSSGLAYTETGRKAFRATATDGIPGWFNGAFVVKTAYGNVTYGEHCAQYGTIWWCRFGNYNYASRKFHPAGNWAKLVS